jgi:hypothetical protein
MTSDLLNDHSYLASRFSFFGMGSQSLSGICFNQEAARALVSRIEIEMREIEAEVEPRLPPRKLKKSEEGAFTIPAKPFKKDGSLSATMERFLERHGIEKDALIPGSGPPTFQWLDGSWQTVEAGALLPANAPMKLGNQEDLKAWFLEDLGWIPVYFNYQKDARGKPVRDKKGQLIQTSPKIQDGGKLCPNLEALEGPLVKQVVRWLSLRNRLSVVQGWLENPRLAYDGRLSAGASGIASSHRQRHVTVVNVPKAEDGVVLGKEMRSLFTARPGRVLVGYDAAALEARVEAHYCMPYQGGEEYAHDLLEGDIHLKTAASVFADKLEGIIGTENFHKDHPLVKPWRSKSKTVRYSTAYGAGPPKLAKTLGVSAAEGEDVYNRFWEASKPLAEFRSRLTEWWETKGQKKFIKGIDGRLLYSRSKHSLVNLAQQSCGAIAMDYSLMFLDKWLGGLTVDSQKIPCYHYKGHTIYRVIFMHDEVQLDCPEEIAEEVGRMGVKSIEAAGRYLKLRVPLTGSFNIGPSWATTH